MNKLSSADRLLLESKLKELNGMINEEKSKSNIKKWLK